jgi:hypothetical protein
MHLIASITIFLLSLMATFHLYWAFGGQTGLDKVIPTRDGVALIRPGRFATLLVAAVLFAMTAVAYLLAFGDAVGSGIRYTGWTIALLFFLRAVGDFNAVGFFKKITATEFATYDTRWYSPLCLLLSSAFILLSID